MDRVADREGISAEDHPSSHRDALYEVAGAAITAAHHAYLANVLRGERVEEVAAGIVDSFEAAEDLERCIRGAATAPMSEPAFQAMIARTLRAAADAVEALDAFGRTKDD